MRPFLPRTVVLLGAVSFLNDTASEMIAPLLPVFLTAVLGAGPAVVGLVEGLAEAAASLLKLISGRLADRGWSVRGLVIGGYGLSNAARPLIGLGFGWAWVLVLRFLDRVGKGLRTAPRDALIAAVTPVAQRGRAFGFHRALDHAGAMLGPLLAFVLLQRDWSLPQVFYASLGPGLLLILLLGLGLQAPRRTRVETLPLLTWRGLDLRLRGVLVATGTLSLAAVPEAFLVLWAHEGGLQVDWVPLLWAAAHAVKAAVSLPGGLVADRWGRLRVLGAGWSLRVLVLLGLAGLPASGGWLWGLFLGYAAALALTEGAERALLGDLAPAPRRGTVFGLYHLLVGLLVLPGALWFGAVWQWIGRGPAFLLAALVTAVAAAALGWVAHRART